MKKDHAFTLIEMLLVVALIVVLISLLLPSLGNARDTARVVVCATNQKQIGEAQMAYLVEHSRRFPQLSSWSGLVGGLGTSGYYSSSSLNVTDRPLNPYLGGTTNNTTVAITECPSDLGDSIYAPGAVTNCFKQYGTSYLVEWGGDAFRTKMVYGVKGIGGRRSMGMGGITSPSNKLLLADWVWHGNRPITRSDTRWHNKAAVRQYNTLFADGHVEYFVFPVEYIESALNGGSYYIAAPDPSFLWW